MEMRTGIKGIVVLAVTVLGAGSFGFRAIWGTAAGSGAGSIVPTGDTTAPRFSHTATLLPNGNVLIAGGMERNGVFLATAELYDPATGRFTPAGKMGSTRGFGSTATLLPNGRVLVAGGRGDSGFCNSSAELYDPAAGTFRPAGSMTIPRCHAVAVRLHTGKVLIIGGDQSPDTNPQASAELYDPATGKFTATGSMRTPRDYFAAVLMKDGKVLVLGGSSGGQRPNTTVEASTEVYDPSTGRFTPAGKMTIPREKLGAALLGDGRVLVAGGPEPVSSTEIYDPATGRFTRGAETNWKRFKLPVGLVALRDGRVLIAGGADKPEVYDPASGSLLPATGSTLDGFYFSTTTLLRDGKVLIVGGYGYHPGPAVNHAWLYQP